MAQLVRNEPGQVRIALAWALATIGVALLASTVLTTAPLEPDKEVKIGPVKASAATWSNVSKVIKGVLTPLSFVLFAVAAWTTVDGLAVSLTRPDRPRIAARGSSSEPNRAAPLSSRSQ